MAQVVEAAELALRCWAESMSLATFARNALSDYKSTGAVVPSSRQLARAMVRPFLARPPRVALEFGPGTGVITRELLDVLPNDGLLLAFEVSSRFVEHLRESILDERLVVVGAGAETAAEELRRRGIERVDAVASSLALSLMDAAVPEAVLRPLLPYLGDRGILTQYQYYVSRVRVHNGCVEAFSVEDLLGRYFETVRATAVWMNLPPAYVIECTWARVDPKDR